MDVEFLELNDSRFFGILKEITFNEFWVGWYRKLVNCEAMKVFPEIHYLGGVGRILFIQLIPSPVLIHLVSYFTILHKIMFYPNNCEISEFRFFSSKKSHVLIIIKYSFIKNWNRFFFVDEKIYHLVSKTDIFMTECN
jgi:hypothetical protein